MLGRRADELLRVDRHHVPDAIGLAGHEKRAARRKQRAVFRVIRLWPMLNHLPLDVGASWHLDLHGRADVKA